MVDSFSYPDFLGGFGHKCHGIRNRRRNADQGSGVVQTLEGVIRHMTIHEAHMCYIVWYAGKDLAAKKEHVIEIYYWKQTFTGHLEPRVPQRSISLIVSKHNLYTLNAHCQPTLRICHKASPVSGPGSKYVVGGG